MGAVDLMTTEGELRAPVATARLVRFNFPEPVETVVRDSGTYRVDLCLTPRPRHASASNQPRRSSGGLAPWRLRRLH
jgi:hypothetical protein